MKKFLAIAVMSLAALQCARAQAPATWSVNPNAYSNAMTITCELYHLCDVLKNADNVVAAFVGGQCRGVVKTSVPVDGRQLAYLTVYSNTVGETISFQAYDADRSVIFPVLNQIAFNTNGVGGINNPVILADNYAPTDIALSTYRFQEDITAGAVIATLTATDPDQGDVRTFSLPQGEFDNDKYTLNGDRLLAKGPYRHDAEPEHTVRITVTDATGCSYTKNITLTLIGVNQQFAPEDLTFKQQALFDRIAPGTFAGVLSTTDVDQQTGHVYTLGSCMPRDGNNLFIIRKDSVFTRATLYYDQTPTLQVCIRTTDEDGLFYEKSFSLILEEPHDPTDISIDNLTIKEGNHPDYRVGRFTTVDEDEGDTFTYDLTPGNGDEDNAQFYIVNDALYVTATTNYDVRNVYHLRIRSSDTRGAFIEKSFTVTIEDDPRLSPALPVVNYISPNGDGRNDYWAIQNVEIYRDFSLRILDTFGNVLYSKESGYQNEWDGKLNGNALPDGNYFFVFQNGKKIYRGNIAIVNQ